MNPGTQLILGCVMCSAVITYAWWSRIRVLLLQMDLGSIRDAFRDKAVSEGWQDDEPSQELLRALELLIRSAPSISPAIIMPISRISGGDPTCLLGPDAEPFFKLYLERWPVRRELDRVMHEVYSRFRFYLRFETLSGWISVLKLKCFGIDSPEFLLLDEVERLVVLEGPAPSNKRTHTAPRHLVDRADSHPAVDPGVSAHPDGKDGSYPTG